jgi:hypothetical protein
MIPRIISAQMLERYIFNFRMKPEAMERHLPATWLKPQVMNGWSVVSFCVLNLDRLTIWPIPPLLRFQTLSCAYRAGVIDHSGSAPTPSVYITDRNADLSLVARLGPILFHDSMPRVQFALSHEPHQKEVLVNFPDGQGLFSAEFKETDTLKSEVFASVDDFVHFIKGGVSSYTPSIYRHKLTRVDLAKEDTKYTPQLAEIDFNSLDGPWKDTDMVFDSAIHASGGRYRWTYRGLRSYEPKPATSERAVRIEAAMKGRPFMS